MKKGTIIIKPNFIKRVIGVVILFILFLLMIGHSVNTKWIQSYFPNGSILILISSIAVFIFFRQKSKNESNWNFFLPFFLPFSIFLLYALINGTTEEIEKLIYLYLSMFLIYKSNIKYSDLIIIGLINSISSLYLANKYTNLKINSLGIIFSFGIIGLINFIDYKFKKNKIAIYLVLAIISTLFISLTRMRGAILAITIIYTYTIMREFDTNKKRIFALILMPMILMLTWNVASNFFGTYLFVNKWGGSDFTTGRMNIWKYILDNAGLFGIGVNYIFGYAHAHNTLIHFIGRYGLAILPFISFCFY